MLHRRQVDIGGMRDEKNAHRHVDRSAVHVEGEPRRHHQSDHLLLAPEPLQLFHAARDHGLRRGRGKYEQNLVFEVAQDLPDLEPGESQRPA